MTPVAEPQHFRAGDRVRPSPYALTQCAIWLIPKMAKRRGTVSPNGQKRGRRVYVVWDGTKTPALTYPSWLEMAPDEQAIEPATTG